MTPRIRVLVVDDSAFARKVMREVLAGCADVEVVGTARDGLDALEQIAALHPDVVTLDLVMPNLDGLGVLDAMVGNPAAPRFIVVSMSGGESSQAVAALQAGAVDLVQKPTALATDRLYEISAELRAKIIAAAAARPRLVQAVVREEPPAASPELAQEDAPLVVVGTSTGGPQALTRLLSALPADFPSPVAIVLHIPVGYTEAVARRLDEACALEVLEASPGLRLQRGRVVLARAGMHLKLARDGDALRAVLDVHPLHTQHRPAVDVLFQSAAEVCGSQVVAAVLTGMGDDGLEGSRAVKAAGGVILTEAAESCVIYGMPRSVAEAGLSSGQVHLDVFAQALGVHVKRMMQRRDTTG